MPRRRAALDLDDVAGSRVGRVHGFYVDAVSGDPAWLIAALGFRGRRKVAVPMRECAVGAGRAWTAQEGAALRAAPTVDPRRPLLREHEAAICAHYGLGERCGRHAELAGRPDGAVTAEPVLS